MALSSGDVSSPGIHAIPSQPHPTQCDAAGTIDGRIVRKIEPEPQDDKEKRILQVAKEHTGQEQGPIDQKGEKEHRIAMEVDKSSTDKGVEKVRESVVTAASTDVGPSSLKPPSLEERVETGLIPTFPIPGKGPGPFSILDRMDELGISEVRVAVINNGRVEWSRDWSLEAGKMSERPDMLSQAASITKVVTSLTILSLVKEGKISLDTNVKTILGDSLWDIIDPKRLSEGPGNEVTIERLLSHTAGIVPGGGEFYSVESVDQHFLDEITTLMKNLSPPLSQRDRTSFDASIKDLRNLQRNRKETPADNLSLLDQNISKIQQEVYALAQSLSPSISQKDNLLFTKTVETLKALQEVRKSALSGPISTDDALKGKLDPVYVATTPGKEFEYSNPGYMILQKVVEKVTGETFEETVQKRVLTPLGMTETTFSPSVEKTISGNDEEGNSLLGRWRIIPYPSCGGLWTNASDFSKVVLGIQKAFTGEDTSVISPELAAKMLEDPPHGEDYHYNLGVEINKTKDGQSYFLHGGSNKGCRTLMLGNIKNGQGVVILTNSDKAGKVLAHEIVKSVAEAYKWPGRETLPFAELEVKPEEVVPVNPESWVRGADGVGGTYSCKEVYDGKEFEHLVDVSFEGGKILAKVDKDHPERCFTITLFPLNEKTACFREHAKGPYTLCDFHKEATGERSLFLFGAKHVRVLKDK